MGVYWIVGAEKWPRLACVAFDDIIPVPPAISDFADQTQIMSSRWLLRKRQRGTAPEIAVDVW